jgi:hypothetical protein
MIHIIKKRENARADARDELRVDGATLPASLELRQAPGKAHRNRIDQHSSPAGRVDRVTSSFVKEITL